MTSQQELVERWLGDALVRAEKACTKHDPWVACTVRIAAVAVELVAAGFLPVPENPPSDDGTDLQ